MVQKHWGESKNFRRHLELSIYTIISYTQVKRTVSKKKNKPSRSIKRNHRKRLLMNDLKRTQKGIKLLAIFIVILLMFGIILGFIYFNILNAKNNGSTSLIVDTDSDDLEDSWERENGLDPFDRDTDKDGMPDGWEVKYALAPLINDSGEDIDQDGYDKNNNGKLEQNEYYTNLEEYNFGTDPRLVDSDKDGMTDGWEIYFREKYELFENNYWLSDKPIKLDPTNNADANDDFDFIAKKVEGKVVGFLLDPDKLNNIQEFNKGTDPTNPDTDFDGLTDYDEVERYGTSPISVDTDHDNLWDGWEIEYGGFLFGLDPLKFDTDNDGENDTFEDLDNDTLWNLDEYKYGTSPLSNDTDNDGLPDNWEDKYWNHQTNDHPNPTYYDSEIDSDNDGLINLLEFIHNTDPKVQDTDNDGLFDGLEVVIGFNGILLNGSYLTSPEMARYFTDPLKVDTDDDTINDYEEVNKGDDGYLTNATNSDSDGDGLNDAEEVDYSTDGFITNPNEVDTDNDLLTDYQEIFGIYGYFTHPTKADTDNDLLLDGEEIFTDFHPFFDFDANITPYNCIDSGPVDGTNPLDRDTDKDGMWDGWEAKFGFAARINFTDSIKKFDTKYGYARYGTNYTNQLSLHPKVAGVWLVNPLDPRDRYDDIDEDGLNESVKFTNIEEFNWSTNPLLYYTDEDIMHDGWEAYYWDYSPILGIYGPDPAKNDGELDLDNDGIEYYINRKKYSDSFTNAEEYLEGTDPNNDDTNGNGPKDYHEIWFGDNDGDGLLNGFEIIFNGKITDPNGYTPDNPIPWGFDPNKNDTDGDGITDDLEDYDGDGYNNWDEQYIYYEVHKGYIISGPGCADPTNSSITPETVKKGIARGTRSNNHNEDSPTSKSNKRYDSINPDQFLNSYKNVYQSLTNVLVFRLRLRCPISKFISLFF